MKQIWIVQRPRHEGNFDHDAIKALGGEVNYLLPAAPNLMDQQRLDDDIARISAVLEAAGPNDVFVTLGGSPISQMMFGAACARVGKGKFNYGLYSRAQDRDGRRGGQKGSYRIVPVSLGAEAA